MLSKIYIAKNAKSYIELRWILTADTCVAGAMYLLIRDEGKTASVFSYNDKYKPVTVTIGTAATLWEDPTSGQPYILVINQALFFGDKVQVSLLNPNQLRANGLRVDDVPRQLLCNSTHSIYFLNKDVRIPLCLDGITSGFKSRKPTMQEVDEMPHLELTADSIWKPSSTHFAEMETTLVASVSTVHCTTDTTSGGHKTHCHDLQR